MSLQESFLIDTEPMLASTMDRQQHRSKSLTRVLSSRNLLAYIGARTRLFSISSGMAGNDDLVILDISYWQNDAFIDYKLLSENIDGVILRAVYGIWEDTRFKIHYRNFKQYGIPIGAYDYIIGNHSGYKQAEVFNSVISELDLKLGYWADVEDTREKTGLTQTVVDDFISKSDQLLPQPADIYTGPYCWTAIMGNKGGYGDRKLWLANYGVTKPKMPINGEWTDWWLWQYTDKGTHKGYHSSLDTNRFNYSVEIYNEWVGGNSSQVPPAEIPSGNVLFRAQCICGALYIRSGPSSTYSSVGALSYGNIVDVYEISDNNWYRIAESEWVSGNVSYMQVIELPEDPGGNIEPEVPIDVPEITIPEKWEDGYIDLVNRISVVEKEVQSLKDSLNNRTTGVV